MYWRLSGELVVDVIGSSGDVEERSVVWWKEVRTATQEDMDDVWWSNVSGGLMLRLMDVMASAAAAADGAGGTCVIILWPACTHFVNACNSVRRPPRQWWANFKLSLKSFRPSAKCHAVILTCNVLIANVLSPCLAMHVLRHVTGIARNCSVYRIYGTSCVVEQTEMPS